MTKEQEAVFEQFAQVAAEKGYHQNDESVATQDIRGV